MRCYYCLIPLTLTEAHKEHMTPRTRGGADTIDNIVPTCEACNKRKGTMTEEEFRTAFSEAFKILTSVPPADSSTNFSLIDQPHIKTLRAESERISWAWKNPA
jgi:hypothetical protein